MGWLRSNRGKLAWLAFFALACQFVFTFGHVHFRNVGFRSTAFAISADELAGGPSSPTQKAPTGLGQDFCAVCNNISLASTIAISVSVVIVPPNSFIEHLQWQLVAIELASRDHFHSNARGPPHI
jgi:hypothetical protein